MTFQPSGEGVVSLHIQEVHKVNCFGASPVPSTACSLPVRLKGWDVHFALATLPCIRLNHFILSNFKVNEVGTSEVTSALHKYRLSPMLGRQDCWGGTAQNEPGLIVTPKTKMDMILEIWDQISQHFKNTLKAAREGNWNGRGSVSSPCGIFLTKIHPPCKNRLIFV